MDLYEYQGKELFKRVGIPVSDGRRADTPQEARAAAQELGGAVVVKAQVLTGGRGKAGGVKLADGPDDAEQKAKDILGLDINGHIVRRLWIERASDIAKEYYLSIAFDRGAKKPLFMFTTQGGVEIEQVAEENPDALIRLHVDPLEGYQPWIARKLIYDARVEDPSEQKQIAAIVEKLYRAFVEFDAMLAEINPLIVTPDGEVKALDSKFTVDDSALFRHPDVAEWRDTSAADPIEAFAREKGVTYVKLDGDVGICGNGAGLSMSTVDVVAHVGGKPANFCDLGGGGSAEGVVDALEVITRDPQVKSIFFNIFGGITRCDEVARGILEALERLDMSSYPIVVRLDGTNAEEGRKILADAGKPNIHPEATMLEGAQRAVELAGQTGDARERCLERPRRAVPHERDPLGRRGSRSRRRLVRARGRRRRARRRDRRRSCRAPAAGGGCERRDRRSGARHASRRDRDRRASAVRRLELRCGRVPRCRASLRRRARCGEGDGPRRTASRRDLRQHVLSESSEEADRLRDPSHVRNYGVDEWKSFFELAGLEVADERLHAASARGRALARAHRDSAGRRRARARAPRPPHRGRLDGPADARSQGSDEVMAIIVDNDTRLVVQGLTGSEGRFHGLRNKAYGTNVVAGVTPGKGGQDVEGIPSSTRSPTPSTRQARTRASSSCLRASPQMRSTRRSMPASAR